MDSVPRLTKAHFERSVMAVPPLARSATGAIDATENTRLIRHLEAGGVSLLLYGGNANIYHLPLDEYEPLLAMVAATASATTIVVPAAGPTYGLMLEHARVLRRQAFQTAMILPQQGITTSSGVATGVRRFVEAAGIPALLYIKHDGFIEPTDVAALCRDGLLSAVKYATVRPDPAVDPYLRELVGVVDPGMIISGIGEQPAWRVHAVGTPAQRDQPAPRAPRGGRWCWHSPHGAAAAAAGSGRWGTPPGDCCRGPGSAGCEWLTTHWLNLVVPRVAPYDIGSKTACF